MDPGFFKRRGFKLRLDRSSSLVWKGGIKGDVQKWIEMVIFKVSSHNLVHSFCVGHPHVVRRPISSKNRGGAPSESAPENILVGLFNYDTMNNNTFSNSFCNKKKNTTYAGSSAVPTCPIEAVNQTNSTMAENVRSIRKIFCKCSCYSYM